MNIIQTTLQEFIKQEELLPQFKTILEDFHRYLVSIEGEGLMRTPENCSEWYLSDLLNEEKERLPTQTKIAYILKENKTLVAFIIWKTEKLNTKVDVVSDYVNMTVTEVLELYVSWEYRWTWLWKELISFVEREWKKDWATKISLDILTNNPAVWFYQELGFRSWYMSVVKNL